jgi:LysM repeat protein
MGYWGWRPLAICVFISVWVAACNIVSDAAPGASPTPSPHVTLTVRRIVSPIPTSTPRQVAAHATTPAPTAEPQASQTPIVYTVQAGDTLGDIALRFDLDLAALRTANSNLDPRALQPGMTLVIPSEAGAAPSATPIPPALPLEAPTCYETPVDTLLCLGIVKNILDTPLEQVLLSVALYAPDGAALVQVPAQIEQTLILPGESAPYRALFDIHPDDVAEVSAELRRAFLAQAVEARFVALEARNVTLTPEGERFVLTTDLYNPDSDEARNIRLVVTLVDEQGHVTGYRVAQAGQSLAPGETLSVQVEIAPQTQVSEPMYTLYVEARRAADA